MQKWAFTYVENAVKKYPMAGHVLEAGSFNVNGTIRGHFKDRQRFPSYLGIDMRPGPDVDEVMRADKLDLISESYGCVVCCEMLEHDDRMWESVKEFYRVLKPGGFAIITTVGILYEKHEYPSDFWRFTREGIRTLMESAGFQTLDIAEAREGRLVMGVWKKE